MKIALFGLGYVGAVSAACFAAAGHDVTGVDVDASKVDLIKRGRSPVTEPGLDELLAEQVRSGRLTATTDTAAAVRASDLSLVCVGTPSRRNGSLESGYLERVVEQIGAALKDHAAYHVIVIRSTVLPGVVESVLTPILEESSGKRVGHEVGLCVNPEFLRESSAIRDFQQPPFTIVGETDSRAGDVLLQAYAHIDAPVRRVRPAEASMIKYASNAYHALKVAFSNEIGALCQQLDIDGRTVMKVFCEDRDLNVSHRYLQPGFGFGGSCLPKDVRALNYVSRDSDMSTPLLASVIPSNEAHIGRVVDVVLASGKRKVALLGLSFKRGTDDLRESPFVTLAEALIGKGVTLRVCDPDVTVGHLVGRNRAYIEERLPHVAQLLVADWCAAVEAADVVIVAKRLAGTENLAEVVRADQLVVDLVGIDGLRAGFRPWAGANLKPAVVAQS
ncbi:nucleotide sugar dehydrogenase [Luteitalea sp.]|uniref:nucleotide sugar dehydrogenase n=1 Tax=Luteitalea sp. TaxID=2004800 RepID=UPI0025BE8D0F|nr:nucleotide sugar dehydrogenase [Luteitalea sp.]